VRPIAEELSARRSDAVSERCLALGSRRHLKAKSLPNKAFLDGKNRQKKSLAQSIASCGFLCYIISLAVELALASRLGLKQTITQVGREVVAGRIGFGFPPGIETLIFWSIALAANWSK